MVDVLKAHKVHDASKSLRGTPQSVEQWPLEKEAYVTVDALKNFMTTMTDIMLQ